MDLEGSNVGFSVGICDGFEQGDMVVVVGFNEGDRVVTVGFNEGDDVVTVGFCVGNVTVVQTGQQQLQKTLFF